MPTMLYIEAGESFPAFKQQNMLGSPSGELPEGLVQANLIFKSKATLKSSETPFRVKRDRGSEGEKNPKPTSAPSGHLLPKEGGKNRARASPYLLYFAALLIFMLALPPFEPTDPIDPIEPAPLSFIHNQRAIRPMG